jgi:hypothetical protein
MVNALLLLLAALSCGVLVGRLAGVVLAPQTPILQQRDLSDVMLASVAIATPQPTAVTDDPHSYLAT